VEIEQESVDSLSCSFLSSLSTEHHLCLCYSVLSGRPCNVSDVLVDLVGAVEPLAQKQKRTVKLSEFSQSLQVSVEEPALRQALGNLIEGALFRTHVGGNVEIVSVGAPAGGALVVIDDDGPDMHYMVRIWFSCAQTSVDVYPN